MLRDDDNKSDIKRNIYFSVIIDVILGKKTLAYLRQNICGHDGISVNVIKYFTQPCQNYYSR